MTCFFAHPEVGAICGHQRHHVVRLFHGISMKRRLLPSFPSMSRNLQHPYHRNGPLFPLPWCVLANIYVF